MDVSCHDLDRDTRLIIYRLECTLPFASSVKQKMIAQPASSSNNNKALDAEKQPAAKQECCSCHERQMPMPISRK